MKPLGNSQIYCIPCSVSSSYNATYEEHIHNFIKRKLLTEHLL